MNTLELKGSLHELIARVNDFKVLADLHKVVFEFIQQKKEDVDWWDELTPEEQQELDIAIAESYDEKNLVSHEEATATIESWLNK